MRFVKGGVNLLAGQPGIGKSMLAIQLALDLARQGRKALYVLTQQSREQPAQRARLIMTGWPGSLPDLEQAIFYPSV
ncbi:AAA family ATPase [Limisphaera ngatamarikiensis]|uniref:AAA family ATPase n=1 Tax=Limisphaera ngatamarikiensis TaxID=1324935 RepID=A0A6M1RV05_9BACT|nr:AAA family ATPase [Limisphaera ngatamarikiensis]